MLHPAGITYLLGVCYTTGVRSPNFMRTGAGFSH